MLAIGRAMMARPWILLLDEPSMGLSPILLETGSIALEGGAVELSEHPEVQRAYLGEAV